MKMLFRILVLMFMVVLGFTALFPEWLELKDIKIDQWQAEKEAANDKRLTVLKQQQATQAREQVFSASRFPDENFRQCLLGTRIKDLQGVRVLKCTSLSIKSLEGLEYLTRLKKLDLSDNQIKAVDLSSLNVLEAISLNNNQVEELQLLNTSNLGEIYLKNNLLNSFVAAESMCIRKLDLSGNQLVKFSSRQRKSCLNSLQLQHNQLTELEWPEVASLSYLDLRHNKLHTTDLKVSLFKNSRFQFLLLGGNTINLEQQLKIKEEVSQARFRAVSANDFPDTALRTCIDKQPFKKLSDIKELDCGSEEVTTITMNKTDKVKSVMGLQLLAHLTAVDLSNQDLFVWPNIELKYLEKLQLNYNNLSSIDLSIYPSLNEIYMTRNKLTAVDLSRNEHLRSASFSQNKLTHIKLPKSAVMRDLSLGYNKLKQVDISGLVGLQSLAVNDNELTSLDVSKNVYLNRLSYERNQMDKDQLAGLSKRTFKRLTAQSSQFPDMNLSNCVNQAISKARANHFSEISELSCNHEKIGSTQGIELLTGLTRLSMKGAKITDIDLSLNPGIEHLDLSNNSLMALNVNQLVNLIDLNLYRNQLTGIDFSMNHKLVIVNLSKNKIENMDFSGPSEMDSLNLSYNQLRQFNVAGMKKNQLI